MWMVKIKTSISILMGKLEGPWDKGLQQSMLCLPRPFTEKLCPLAFQESLEDWGTAYCRKRLVNGQSSEIFFFFTTFHETTWNNLMLVRKLSQNHLSKPGGSREGLRDQRMESVTSLFKEWEREFGTLEAGQPHCSLLEDYGEICIWKSFIGIWIIKWMGKTTRDLER